MGGRRTGKGERAGKGEGEGKSGGKKREGVIERKRRDLEGGGWRERDRGREGKEENGT